MTTRAAVQDIVTALRSLRHEEELRELLHEICRQFGFAHFALVQHVEVRATQRPGLRLHNYPDDWVALFDRNRLTLVDPIHRASHTTLTGFRWSDVPAMIPLSPRDRDILAEARTFGLVNGFTVPAHIPGELLGSCSFVAAGELDQADFPVAHWIGQLAFEAARTLMSGRPAGGSGTLTPRQLECIMYVGRGKTDGEIAQILGVSHNTIIEHLKHARARYSAVARATLPVLALWEGALSFADFLTR